VDPFVYQYARSVCLAGVIASVGLLGFFAGYRWGYLDGYAQFSIESDGRKMRLVPIDPPADCQ